MKRIGSLLALISLLVCSIIAVHCIQTTVHASNSALWDGTTTTQPTSMKTIDGVYYYEISTAEELAYIAKTGGDWFGYNYILAKDITLNSVELTYDANGNLTVNASTLNQWTPISNFTGIFNGNDFSISGLYVNVTGSAGLFATMSGSVKNLTIKNAYVKGGNYVGGICGKSNIGGKQISNCTFYGAVIGTSYVAGITGSTDGYSGSYIGNCTNYGDIWSTGGKTGGIIGYASSYTASVSNCVNNGTILFTGDNVGGICGSYFWSVDNCTNNGNVTGNNNVGGICGYKNVPVGSSTNHGNITGKNNVGGIVGYSTSDSSGSTLYNTGNIVGESYVGGICGYGTGRDSDDYFTVSEAYNTGDVNGVSYVGGLIGYTFNTNLSKGYSTGTIVGTSNVGALIGYSESVWGKGRVSNCYYLKTDTINNKLWGLGNTSEDSNNITTAKDLSFFCINADKTLNTSGHTYSSTVPCDATCDTCGYERTVTHTYDNIKYDSDKHWYECDCGEKKVDSEASHTGGTATCTNKAKCDVCKQSYGDLNTNNHTVAINWTSANDQHYHTCTNGCDAKLDLANCADSDKNHKCDVCATDMGTHEAASGKHTCDYCGQTVTECADTDKDHKCDVCSAAMGTHEAAPGKHTCDYCGQEVSTDPSEPDSSNADMENGGNPAVVIMAVVSVAAISGAAVLIALKKRK